MPGFRIYIATGGAIAEKSLEFLKAMKAKGASLEFVTIDAAKNNANMILCRGSFPVYGPNKMPQWR